MYNGFLFVSLINEKMLFLKILSLPTRIKTMLNRRKSNHKSKKKEKDNICKRPFELQRKEIATNDSGTLTTKDLNSIKNDFPMSILFTKF